MRVANSSVSSPPRLPWESLTIFTQPSAPTTAVCEPRDRMHSSTHQIRKQKKIWKWTQISSTRDINKGKMYQEVPPVETPSQPHRKGHATHPFLAEARKRYKEVQDQQQKSVSFAANVDAGLRTIHQRSVGTESGPFIKISSAQK